MKRMGICRGANGDVLDLHSSSKNTQQKICYEFAPPAPQKKKLYPMILGESCILHS